MDHSEDIQAKRQKQEEEIGFNENVVQCLVSTLSGKFSWRWIRPLAQYTKKIADSMLVPILANIHHTIVNQATEDGIFVKTIHNAPMITIMNRVGKKEQIILEFNFDCPWFQYEGACSIFIVGNWLPIRERPPIPFSYFQIDGNGINKHCWDCLEIGVGYVGGVRIKNICVFN
jgi:hypothetical protein